MRRKHDCRLIAVFASRLLSHDSGHFLEQFLDPCEYIFVGLTQTFLVKLKTAQQLLGSRRKLLRTGFNEPAAILQPLALDAWETLWSYREKKGGGSLEGIKRKTQPVSSASFFPYLPSRFYA
jgi:hypothetical protein